jgi:hypothetical protein
MVCPKCKSRIPSNSEYCLKCGFKIENVQTSNKKYKLIISAISIICLSLIVTILYILRTDINNLLSASSAVDVASSTMQSNGTSILSAQTPQISSTYTITPTFTQIQETAMTTASQVTATPASKPTPKPTPKPTQQPTPEPTSTSAPANPTSVPQTSSQPIASAQPTPQATASLTSAQIYEIQHMIEVYEGRVAQDQTDLDQANTNLYNVQQERTVSMLVNGVWTWVADPEAVAAAQQEVTKAQNKLQADQNELAYWEGLADLYGIPY